MSVCLYPEPVVIVDGDPVLLLIGIDHESETQECGGAVRLPDDGDLVIAVGAAGGGGGGRSVSNLSSALGGSSRKKSSPSSFLCRPTFSPLTHKT